MSSESPQFVNADHEAIEEQALPPRRSARKRPAPPGGRRGGPAKRAREVEPADDDSKEAEANETKVEKDEERKTPEAPTPRANRRREPRPEPTITSTTSTGVTRAERNRTMDIVRARREQEEEEEVKSEAPQEPRINVHVEVVAPRKEKSGGWCRFFFVVVWTLYWLGSTVLYLMPDPIKTQRTYQSWVLSELRSRDEWKFLESYRVNVTELSVDLGQAEKFETELKRVSKIISERELRVQALTKEQAALAVDDLPKSSADPAFTAAKSTLKAARALVDHTKKMQTLFTPKEDALNKASETSIQMQLIQLENEFNAAQTRLAKALDTSQKASLGQAYTSDYETLLQSSILDAALEAAQDAAVDARTLVNAAQSVSDPDRPLDARAVSDFVFAKLDAALRAEEGFDFASMRTGGHIIAANTSRDFASTLSWSQRRSGKYGQSASVVLNTPGGGGGLAKGHHLPLGSCFAFSGSQGQLAVQLAAPVIPTKFVLEHAAGTADTSLFGHSASAPYNFSILGYPTHQLTQTPSYSLGSFAFEHPLRSHRQVFDLEPSPVDLSALILQVHTNHGNPDYTCIYRLAVYATA